MNQVRNFCRGLNIQRVKEGCELRKGENGIGRKLRLKEMIKEKKNEDYSIGRERMSKKNWVTIKEVGIIKRSKEIKTD